MPAPLNKIFWFYKHKSRLTLGIIALLAGLIFLLFSLHAFQAFRKNFGPDKAHKQYLIINKNVGFGNTLLNNKARLTDDEIQLLKKQAFVQDFGLFTPNQYEIWIYAHQKLNFGSELFFESVPAKFLDNKPANWNWSPHDPYVPIIISKEFLQLYNFGYAISKGLPQISESTAKMIPLKVKVSGKGGEKKLKAKITAFSERIPSVLVPASFMNWANKNIGLKTETRPSRAIIKVDNRHHQALKDFFADNTRLKPASNSLLNSKTGVFIQAALGFTGFIGIMFFLLSLLVLLLNFRIVFGDKQKDVDLLLQIGYHPKTIGNLFFKRISLIISATFILSLALVITGNCFIADMLHKNGLDYNAWLYPEILIAFLILAGITLLTVKIYINRWLKKIHF